MAEEIPDGWDDVNLTTPDQYIQQLCTEFLNREAEILDDRRLNDWLELLTKDIRYEVPVRITREAGAKESEFSDESYHYRENWDTLNGRIDRFEDEYAWSENPPSRTRRFVSNVRIDDIRSDELDVKNNLLLYRNQGDSSSTEIFTGERHDIIRRVNDELKLAKRTVFLDRTILGAKGAGLSIFL